MSFKEISVRTFAAYVRMSCTVVVSVVVRICLDCIGIILTGQEPTAVGFWFAHCSTDGGCVLAGILIFLVTLLGCSFFAWSCRGWIMDPAQNRFARQYSFSIIVEAATWVPISVGVGKTNAIVEWCMREAEGEFVQVLISSAIALLLTTCCALLAHLAMKYFEGVASSGSHAMGPEAGLASFGRFCLLTFLYCSSWAAAWSNWRLVLAVIDSLAHRLPGHDFALAVAVIAPVLIFSVCFYLRFGPEPIIPDPKLQQLCYSHGYSGSIRRSLVSFWVYSCIIFIVMSICDSTYGAFHFLTDKVYSSSVVGVGGFDAKLPVVLCMMACTVTIVASFCLASITRVTEVDELSSMRMSRSAHEAQSRMLLRRRWLFERDHSCRELNLKSAAEGLELQDRKRSRPWPFEPLDAAVDHLRATIEQEFDEHPADDAAGRPKELAHPKYVRQLSSEDEGPREQDRANGISWTICASVLLYDVLGLVVCVQWGAVAFRTYVVLLGRLAGLHTLLYALSAVAYAAAVVAALARFVRSWFPSSDELRLVAPQMEQGQAPFLGVEPDTEEEEAAVAAG